MPCGLLNKLTSSQTLVFSPMSTSGCEHLSGFLFRLTKVVPKFVFVHRLCHVKEVTLGSWVLQLGGRQVSLVDGLSGLKK